MTFWPFAVDVPGMIKAMRKGYGADAILGGLLAVPATPAAGR